MMLSEEKITHLSHVLLKELFDGDIIDISEDEGKIRREIKRIIVNELKIGEDIDIAVRKKLQSFSKKLAEGSPEWEVLYRKFFKEEEMKRGRASG